MSKRKSIINPNLIRKTVAVKNTNTRRLSLLQQSQSFAFSSFYPSESKLEKELNEIFKEAKKESTFRYNPPYQSIKALSYYIRRNRNNMEEIIKQLNKFLDNEDYLSEKIIVNIVDTVLNLLTENSQIINFINNIFPILVSKFYLTNQNISFLEELNNTIGKLIKIGVIYSRQIIENNIDSLFNKVSNENYLKAENSKCAIILFICKIIQSSSTFAFNKLTEKKNFQIIKNLIDNFKDPKKEIRELVYELIYQFCLMLKTRDSSTKFAYIQMIYIHIFSQFIKNIHDNGDTPTNINIFLGFIESVKKIHLAEPLFFLKDDKAYEDLATNLLKAKYSKSLSVKIEFIKYSPELYLINKEVFEEKYLTKFLEFCNSQLNIKTNQELRNAVLLALGKFSLVVSKNCFDLCLTQLINLLKSLIMESKVFDKEIIKCLTDLLNNKERQYLESIVLKFDIYFILSKLFKTGLTGYKVDFLLSIMSSFNSCSLEHVTTAIVSLNIISYIICDEEMKLTNFYESIRSNKINFISPQLETVKNKAIKHIKKYIIEGTEKDAKNNLIINPNSYFSKCKCLNKPNMIIYSLILLSNIQNSFFLKDILIFYNDKVLPFLLFQSPKLSQKVLHLISCRFVQIYDDDKNLSYYILNNIIDSIRNIIFSSKNLETKILAFNILHFKTILLDVILRDKNFFFCKLIGLLTSNEDNIIKEKLIQTIALLALRDNDKSFYISFINKNIFNILFTLSNSDDIIHKENLIKLLFYYTKYLKNIFHSKLIDRIFEIMISMLFSHDCYGIIVIDILKIVCEILDNTIINALFLENGIYNIKFCENCHLLLNVCINIIKEEGVNTTKSEISLNTLFQIIKIHKINIYKDYTSEILLKKENDIDEMPSIRKYTNLKINNINKNINKEETNINRKANPKQNKNEEQNNILNKELISLLENSSKFNIANILLQTITKGASDESLNIIMNIFGLSGALDPLKIDNFSTNQTLSTYHLEGLSVEKESIDSNELKLIRYNPKIRQDEEIDLSKIEPSTCIPIISLMKILIDNTQQETCNQIIFYLNDFIKSLTPNDKNLIDIILPTIFHIIPELDNDNQKKMLKTIASIINIFKNKIVYHLSPLVQLIQNFIISEGFLESISEILQSLFEIFVNEMEKYYSTLIPIILSLIKDNINECADLLHLLNLLTKNSNIGIYLNIILEEIMFVYIRSTEQKVLGPLLEFFENIISIQNTYLFYPMIIKALIEKLNLLLKSEIFTKEKSAKSFKDKSLSGLINDGDHFNIVTKTLNILSLMNEINREHFIKFLPMIIKNCKSLGIFSKPGWEQILKSMINQYNGYLFISPMVFQNMLKKEFCKINCVLGLNIIKKENTNQFLINNIEIDSYENDSKLNIRRQGIRKSEKNEEEILENLALSKRKKYKNRKALIDINQIINIFQTTNCSVEDDWNEWFKSSSKILFEQSPSYALFYCHYVIDYYYPLIKQLYSYAFYSTIRNINNENKSKIIDDLLSALNSPKTPNDILLTILDLTEYIERKNLGISFFDYSLFGKVAYKCRAFAKALYFKENYFLINKGPIEDLIDLYYELKLPESAEGLLKYLQKKEISTKRTESKLSKKSSDENTKTKENKDYNEFIWYIKLHRYDQSLEIINKKLEKEEDKNEIEYLKKNRDICLNGLCNWEQLLLDEGNIENNNTFCGRATTFKDFKDIDNKLKKEIEKELLISKACINLGEWEKLEYHFSKINEKFIDYFNLENQLITKENEQSEENYIDDYDYSYNNETNTNIGNANSKYLENLYLNIPKYLTKYEDKKDTNMDNLFQYKDKEGNIQAKNEVFICYNDIINNSTSFSFLLNQDEIIFDLNLYSSIINIEKKEYNLAMKYIAEDKKMINSRIKSLLGESYIRGYELLIKNQLLFNLEQIIDYKSNHNNNNEYLEKLINTWDKSLNIIGKDPVIYEKFLAIRSLVLPIEKEFNNYMSLAKICRKIDFYDKSMRILNRIKKKMKIDNILIGASPDLSINEKQITIELSYNKCLFEKGLINEAITKSQYLVGLLENAENNENNENKQFSILNKINSKLKSKIYGNLGIYMQKDFNFDDDLNISQKSFNNKSFLRSSHKNFNLRNLNNIEQLDNNNKEEKPSFDLRFLNFNKNIGDETIINHYFTLATSYDKKNYKYWQNYAMFNYRYYKFIFDKKISFEDMSNDSSIDSKDNEEHESETNQTMNGLKQKEELFAINAINGFKYSITLGGKNTNKTFQDVLRLIDIFFNSGGNSENLLDLIQSSFNSLDIDVYLNVIPQLVSRFDLKNEDVLQVLKNILIKIGLAHPNALIYSLIVLKNSSSKARKDAATSVLNGIQKKYKYLIEECEMFISELNKCAMLPHEEWFETIEDSSKLFQNGEYLSMVEHMKRLHLKLNNHFDNMYEINFYQLYGCLLKEAEEMIQEYMENHNDEIIKEAWEIYHIIYRNIAEDFKQFDSISLQYVSPKLYNFRNSNICLPGTYNIECVDNNEKIYKKDNELPLKQDKMIRIRKMGDTLNLFKSKQHPRKMSMIGTDEKEYLFLLKGHEDLRQDERAMQLFDVINTIVSNNRKTSTKNLFIITYSVIPLSHNTGICGWVKNCDTLHQIIKDERTKINILPSAEHRVVYKHFPKFESGTIMSKIETFLEALKVNQGTELYNNIWSRAKNCETWLKRRTNYSRSLAVMSVVGYILGLGDRHPSNLMMNKRTGKIIHIDFGDCFEVAMKREKFPEKVPFRLTRTLIKALEVSEIEGTFRIVCEQIMELLRNNKDSLMAILGSFIHDPLISFRLMIPMIIKNKQKKDNVENNKFKRSTNRKKTDKRANANRIIKNISASLKIPNKPIVRMSRIINPIYENDSNDKEEKEEKEEKKPILKLKEDEKEKPESINEDQEKNEKKRMENDERQIFNQYEENDEIDLEELNKIAQIVLDRIQDKLSGTDFNPEIIYDVKSQIDKLIQQATSNENLAQSYLGWCPFW